MKVRKTILAAAGLLAAAVLPLTGGSSLASAAAPTLGWPGLTCTSNHWIKDVSNGGKVIGVGPQSSGWQLEDSPPNAYPTGDIFLLCSNGNGQYFLQEQLPPVGSPNYSTKATNHWWIGVDVGQHYAITADATAPGPHEAFAIECTAAHQERIHWAVDGDDMFTITTVPPSLWTTPPPVGLPGTQYEISGVC